MHHRHRSSYQVGLRMEGMGFVELQLYDGGLLRHFVK